MTMEITRGIDKDDLNEIEEILKSSGFFYEYEIITALEIAVETISKGSEKSGYRWMKIIDNKKLVAFGNYGKNAFSTHSWELYWIAVHNNSRNKKLGSKLLHAIEDDIKKSGGRILWIETSGRPLYAPTENFYKKMGYTLRTSLKDFYGPDDPKQIYARYL